MKSLKALISKKTIHRAHPGSNLIYVVLLFPGDEFDGMENIETIHDGSGYNWKLLTWEQAKKILPFKHKNSKIRRSPYATKEETIDAMYKYSKEGILKKFLEIGPKEFD